MAIIDTSITGSFIEDRDQNVFIGIDLPFYKSNGPEGYFASTKTTIEAVKNNIRNLIQTEKGERFLQPNLGINLRKFLFEPISLGLEDTIREDVLSTISLWLPFVNVTQLDINLIDSIDRNQIKINVTFNINKAQNMLGSVQIEI